MTTSTATLRRVVDDVLSTRTIPPGEALVLIAAAQAVVVAEIAEALEFVAQALREKEGA